MIKVKLLLTTFFIASFCFSQSDCSFTITNDTTLCNADTVTIWVKGENLDKVKWFGDNIISDDTLEKIQVAIDSTTTFIATNRIIDPVNLVRNGDFELGNQNFTSEYWSSCLNGQMPPGSYCISDRTDIYWPTWRGCADYSKTGPGFMFVTDGATTADEKIWCQTVNVEQNTDYSLSAWLTTLLNLANAQLLFTINDEPIGDIFEAKPEECEWNEFFQIWNSNLSTSAEICITNQNTESNGNDFALDEIALNKVCYKEDSVTISVLSNPDITILNGDTAICPGDTFLIKTTPNYSAPFQYNWNTSAETTNQITFADTGEIIVQISHPAGCSGSDTININPIKNPKPDLGADTTVCLSIKGGLLLSADTAKLTVWTTPTGVDTNATHFALVPGNYTVFQSNGNACNATDRIEIEDFCSTKLFMPNAFTPNGDGLNETFGAESAETYDYELYIFNRVGNLIFESHDLHNRWDGVNSQPGVYAYRVNYAIIDEKTGELENYTKIGSVALIK